MSARTLLAVPLVLPALLLLPLGIRPVDSAEGYSRPPPTYWRPYAHRHAIVLMAGNVEGREPHYGWYWGDTHGMYRELIDREGFPEKNVFFLSYGPKSAEYAEAVHAKSTTENVRKVFRQVAEISGPDDLVYLYWVDHGGRRAFETYDGHLDHQEVGKLIRGIRCRVFVGAFNPCNSGAVIDDVKAERAIICTSVLPEEANRWGWASEWRFALGGGTDKSRSDADGDGRVTLAEAYAWTAARANRAGEHPLIDDNGDGRPGRLDRASFAPSDHAKDGHFASRHTLDAWLDEVPTGMGWIEARLEGRPETGEDTRAKLAEFLAEQPFLEKADLPALIFCHSEERAEQCRVVEAKVFNLPAARRTPFTAKSFCCFRVDVSELTARGSPLLNASTAPAVIVIGPDGALTSVLRGRNVKDTTVARDLRSALTEKQRDLAVSTVERAEPLLRDMTRIERKLSSAREALRIAYEKADATDVAKSVSKLRKLEAEFAHCVARIGELL